MDELERIVDDWLMSTVERWARACDDLQAGNVGALLDLDDAPHTPGDVSYNDLFAEVLRRKVGE